MQRDALDHTDDHDPYDDFTFDEEPMPDGRTIRYYAWPEAVDDLDDADDEAAAVTDV
jgi:hypothetical protein